MEIAMTVATVLQKIRSTYDIIAAQVSLPKQLKGSLSTLLLLEVNATQLMSSKRLPDRSLRCLDQVVALLQALEQETQRHVSHNRLQRMLRLFSGRPKKILQQIQDLNHRLELLGRIKTLAVESSNFDSANLLTSDSIEFWDKFFGSQVYSVAVPDFVTALECENKMRFTTKERRCVEEILDPDLTNCVNVLNFAAWIERFGPLSSVVQTTFENTLSPHTGRMFPFYMAEAYPEEAMESLGTDQRVVLRNSARDGGSFEVFVLMNATVRFIVVRTEGAFAIKDEAELTDSVFIDNLKIKNKNVPKNCFPSLPDLVECCDAVARIMCPLLEMYSDSPKSSYSSDGSSSSSSSSSTRSLHAPRHRLGNRGYFWFGQDIAPLLQRRVTTVLRKNGYTKKNTKTATLISHKADPGYTKCVVLDGSIPENRADIIATRVRDLG